jgi:hypothetical protein
MSRRQAAIKRDSDSVESAGMIDSFESGGVARPFVSENDEESAAVGRRKELRIEGTDLVR